MQDLRKKKVLTTFEFEELTKTYDHLKVVVVPATETMPEYIKLIDKTGLCTCHFSAYKLAEFTYSNFIYNLPEDEQIPVDGENNNEGGNENGNEGGNDNPFAPNTDPVDPGFDDPDPEEPNTEDPEVFPGYITITYENVIDNGVITRVVFLEEDGLHTLTQEDLFTPRLINSQFLGYKIDGMPVCIPREGVEPPEYLQVGDRISDDCTFIAYYFLGKSPYVDDDEDDEEPGGKYPPEGY